MLKLNKNQHRLPIGGHQFSEGGFILRADDFPALVKKLSDYRINNHIPIGNPEQEVLVHYARHWPYMVEESPNGVQDIIDKDYENYRKWLELTWKIPPAKFISSKQADERWEICQNCPFNKAKKWKETKESLELAKRSFLMRRGLSVPHDIGICSLHFSADLSVLSFIENPSHFAEMKKDTAKPEKCWV